MLPSSKPSQLEYSHLPTSESSSDLEYDGEKTLSEKQQQSRCAKSAGLACAAVVGILLAFALGYLTGNNRHAIKLPSGPAASPPSGTCTEPAFRREWRSLSVDEKKKYHDAFQCFIDTPSVLGLNGSLYDDFVWAHNRVAGSNHGKAPFLTWHRRFIWVYEKYLQQKCHYDGALPYWDWSLDWEHPTKSIIFDSKLGFGGNGDPKVAETRFGNCVTDTPFKNLRPQWSGSKYDPHCLVRTFADEDEWFSEYMGPARLEKIMASQTYAEFFLALENGPHDIIPGGVGGDFALFTAPNDPIFYLHHSQLDRVWWLWQMRDKAGRVHNYNGEGDNKANVTLTDILPMSGLDRDLTVADIMDTESGEMCYRYMWT